MRYLTTGALLLGAISSAQAALEIHNWYVNSKSLSFHVVLIPLRCGKPVYIWQSNNGSCDFGPAHETLQHDAFGTPFCPIAIPWAVAPGQTQSLDWISNKYGTSVKISYSPIDNNGILQYEYTAGGDTFYWDVSNLDGLGANLVGTPFANDNVKITPVPGQVGNPDCQEITCAAGQTCLDAYQHPWDPKTKVSNLRNLRL